VDFIGRKNTDTRPSLNLFPAHSFSSPFATTNRIPCSTFWTVKSPTHEKYAVHPSSVSHQKRDEYVRLRIASIFSFVPYPHLNLANNQPLKLDGTIPPRASPQNEQL
jgi:hypothetical protein